MRNERGQIDPRIMLIGLAFLAVVYVANQVKLGIHKAGCKIHVIKAARCQPPQPSLVYEP